MIRVFCGEDRIRAKKEIEKILGDDYEIVDGAEMTPEAMPSVFWGNSLFSAKRNILIRDMMENKAVRDEILKYLDTPHNIVIFELKIDKRAAIFKKIKDKVELREFALPKSANVNMVFDIYRVAKRDGKKAIEMLSRVQDSEEPIMFCGLMVSQALKDYKNNPGAKEGRALKELSKLDLELKTTSLQPWLLVQSFLLRLSLM